MSEAGDSGEEVTGGLKELVLMRLGMLSHEGSKGGEEECFGLGRTWGGS